jgi:hypothetical protein
MQGFFLGLAWLADRNMTAQEVGLVGHHLLEACPT